MNKNMGSTDRMIRLSIAIIIVALHFIGYLPSPYGLIGLGIAAIMVITSFLNFCPLYLPFGIKTNKKK